MTRAGEKLYREPEPPRGSLLWALASAPETLRGVLAVVRMVAVAVLAAPFLGLG